MRFHQRAGNPEDKMSKNLLTLYKNTHYIALSICGVLALTAAAVAAMAS